MKKTALVLALGAAFAGTAMAQSSVTLAGRINESYEFNNGQGQRHTGNFRDNSSRVIIRGVEDLGGNLSAIFGFEWRFAADSASVAGSADGSNPITDTGNSYIGLRHKKLGEVAMGRLDSAINAPLYSQYLSASNFVNHDSGTTGTTGRFRVDNRTSNAIGYKSPVWGGVQVSLRYAQQGPDNQGAPQQAYNTANTAEQDIKQYQAAVDFKRGGLFTGVGATWQSYRDGSVATGAGANQFRNRYQAVAAYDFGFIRPAVFVSRNYFDMTNTTGSGDAAPHQDQYGMSVKLKFGNNSIYGMWLNSHPAAVTASTGTARQRYVGYGYDLSARTNLYAFYQILDSNDTTNGASAGGTAVDTTRTKTLGLGMRHNF